MTTPAVSCGLAYLGLSYVIIKFYCQHQTPHQWLLYAYTKYNGYRVVMVKPAT